MKFSLIFIAVLFLDGLVFPAFFGLRGSFLSLLVIVVPLLYMGPTKQYIIYGLFFSFVYESFRGLNFGDLMLPFLFIVMVTYLVQRIFDIKYTYDSRFSLGKSVLVALILVVLLSLLSLFYRHGSINMDYFNLTLNLTIVVETLILVSIFSIIFNKKSDYEI